MCWELAGTEHPICLVWMAAEQPNAVSSMLLQLPWLSVAAAGSCE